MPPRLTLLAGVITLVLAIVTQSVPAQVQVPEAFEPPDPGTVVTRVLPARVWRTQAAPDPLIQEIVDQVSWPEIAANISRLTQFPNRRASSSYNDAAAETLRAYFAGLGLPAAFHWFTYRNVEYQNVEATQLGRLYPDSIFVVCAHFDSYSNATMAPGADDNATGVAAVMLAARVLSRLACDYTVKYVAFNCEELGCKGSLPWAQAAIADSLAIVGVLNLDMLGWWRNGIVRDLDIVTNDASRWLADACLNAASLYTAAPVQLHVNNNYVIGDHFPFWVYGYDALCIAEAAGYDDPELNPYGHTLNDTIDRIMPDFALDNTRVVIAALATLARPRRPVPAYLAEFRAEREAGAAGTALVRWRLTGPAAGSGFRLWRQEGAAARIALAGPFPAGEETRTVRDEAAPLGAAAYWLEELGAGAGSVWHGPAELAASAAAPGSAVPAALRLLAAAPNPFNPTTVVRFALARPLAVRLSVHDQRGREVRRLLDGAAPAGERAVVWDGRDARGRPAPSGTYLVRLTSELGERSLKVTLAK